MSDHQGDGRTDDRQIGSGAPLWQPVGVVEDDREMDDEDLRPSVGSRIVSVVLALVVGLVYGAVGTVAHPLSVTVLSVTIPWGLIVSLIGVLALFVGFRLVLGERLAVIAAAVGVVGIVALFSLESAGGSVLIQEGTPGLVWVLAPALLGALVVFWPSLPTRTTPTGRTESLESDGRLAQPDEKEFPTP